MAIVRWDPLSEMVRAQREADRVLSRMDREGQRSGGGMGDWMPSIDVKREGTDMAISVDLPGMKPEDVDIEVTEGVLTISGERRSQEEEESEGWIVRESSYGSFQRMIALPEGLDPSSISADYHDGVLHVRVPRAFDQPSPQSTKIAIGGMQAGQQPQRDASGQQQAQPADQQREQTESAPQAESERAREHVGV